MKCITKRGSALKCVFKNEEREDLLVNGWGEQNTVGSKPGG